MCGVGDITIIKSLICEKVRFTEMPAIMQEFSKYFDPRQ